MCMCNNVHSGRLLDLGREANRYKEKSEIRETKIEAI